MSNVLPAGAATPGATAHVHRMRFSADVAALAYLLFLAYGSLVPLAFADRPMHEALASFLPPPWLPIGTEHRADWIANLALYAPAAFLGLWARSQSAVERSVASEMATLLALGAFAVVVEFLQLFFPPRTVSLNDLVAEGLGIAAGGFAWKLGGARFLRRAAQAGYPTGKACAAAFLVGYLLLALAPFDFVVGFDELRARLGSERISVWLASDGCRSSITCTIPVVLHILAGAMLGSAVRLLRRGRAETGWTEAIFAGVVVSASIEFVQIFILSATAQGATVVARALGFALGYRLAYEVASRVQAMLVRRDRNAWVAAACVAFVATLIWVNGLHRARWVTVDELAMGLGEIRFVPFYYHYYVPEAHALVSAAAQLAMYAPVGVLLALASYRPRIHWHGAIAGALVAAGLALVVEAAKLFIGKRPDPTDLLLAAVGGACAYIATDALSSRSSLRFDKTALPFTAARQARVVFGPGAIFGTAALALAVWGVLRQPIAVPWLAIGLIVYAIALTRHPWAWLIVLPALLPVLDLAQQTGRLFFEEFDLFVLVTVGVLALLPPRGRSLVPSAALVVFGSLWLVSTLIAFAIAIFPLPPLTPDTFWSVHSPLAALRVVRATLWAGLLVALANRWTDGRDLDVDRFAKGMTIGLAATGAAALYERLAYASLVPGDEYRAVAMFSAASTAGAQIESFLAAAIPFAIFLLARSREHAWRVAALAALAFGVYAAAATVSRTAVFGITIGALLAIGAELRAQVPARARLPRSRTVALSFVIGLAILAAASSATLARFVTSSPDLHRRLAHWDTILGGDQSLRDLAFGRGLGGYPAWFYWHAAAGKAPPLVSYRASGTETFLRVPSGRGLYLDQIVDALPGQRYIASAALRSDNAATIEIALCHKWILYATACSSATLLAQAGNGWQTASAALVAPPANRAIFQPVTKISVTGVVDGTIDVTRVSLVDANGRDLVRNGAFQRSGLHWFLTADDHWPWNTFNLIVEVAFEQGLVGVLTVVLLIGGLVVGLWGKQSDGDIRAGVWLASIVGFLVPALFDAVIDDPRMRVLFLLLLAMPLLGPPLKSR